MDVYQILVYSIHEAVGRGFGASCAPGPVRRPPSPEEVTRLRALVRQSFSLRPDADGLVASLVADGAEGLQRWATVRCGVPPLPMLAAPVRSIDEVIEKMSDAQGGCIADFKYDGQRSVGFLQCWHAPWRLCHVPNPFCFTLSRMHTLP